LQYAARYTSQCIITVLFLTDSSSTDAETRTARSVHFDSGCADEAVRTFFTQRYGIIVNDASDDIAKPVPRRRVV